MEYFVDLDIGMDWIIEDPNYFNKLKIDGINPNHFHLPVEDLKKEFLLWVEQIGMEVWYSEIFYCPPKGNIFKHSDSIEPKDSCKLNWVYDQGETFMRWFSITDDAELKLRKNFIGGEYFSCEREDQYVFDSQHRIQKPTLVNASAPHDVINDTDFNRWCVSIVLRRKNGDWRIGYWDLKKILESYIKVPSTVAR